mgnify:CR=1 FL=1
MRLYVFPPMRMTNVLSALAVTLCTAMVIIVISVMGGFLDLVRDAGFKPSTPIQEGIDRFITWYRSYYNV